jgi:hypothetical protein
MKLEPDSPEAELGKDEDVVLVDRVGGHLDPVPVAFLLVSGLHAVPLESDDAVVHHRDRAGIISLESMEGVAAPGTR